MKDRKLWLFKIMLGTLLVMSMIFAILIFHYNPVLFYIELTLWLIAAVLIIWRFKYFKSEIHAFMLHVGSTLSAAQSDALLKFPVPLFVIGNNGEIVWYNQLAKETMFKNRDDLFEQKIQKIFPEIDLRKLNSQGGQRVANSGRYYTAFSVFAYGRKDKGSYIVYFVEDTEIARQAQAFHDSRPSVLSIVIDNYEELMQGAKESQKAQVLGEIEGILEKFVSEAEGLLKRMDRNRFVAVIEERHMLKIIEKRFDVLDKVRSIPCDNNIMPTLSIGIGRGVGSFHEADKMASQALEMALGRGGDQAALKTPDGFEFYGGVSKGIEKRNKVKTRIVAAALKDLIQSSENVIVMGHKFADLDCLGSAIGMAKAVKSMGKPCSVVVNTATNLAAPLYNKFVDAGEASLFLTAEKALERVGRKSLLIIVDTHLPYLLESRDLYELSKNVVVIDHHRKMVGHIENAVIFYHEPYASSASEMVSELLQYFDGDRIISGIDAEALLSGIMLDTRNFAMRTGVRTFEAAAYLRRMGADTIEVKKLFSSSMTAYQKKMQIVSSARIYDNCAIAESEMWDDIKLIAPQAADELLGITGVDASFVMYEYGSGVSFSARSLGNVNVQIIMEKIGGGGHFTMAGAQLENISMEKAEELLKNAIREYNEERNVNA